MGAGFFCAPQVKTLAAAHLTIAWRKTKAKTWNYIPDNFRKVPNAPILAGDTTNASLGIYQISNTVFISHHNNIIEINSKEQLKNASIKIYDLLGKEIHSQTFSGTQTEITIEKKGIYVVEVIGEKVNVRKKVF